AVQEAVKLYFGDAETFRTLGDRCMAKDLSWEKSAVLYDRMYSDVADVSKDSAELPFETAFKRIKRAYEKLHRRNVDAGMPLPPEDYHRSIQVQIIGKGSGVFHVVFRGQKVEIDPTTCHGADGNIAASFDNLLGMAEGKISPDKLFMNGQMKVGGNLVKGAELRKLLVPWRKK
ncbi:MAG: SCP2 sterol-binding domain-containing protein, partial [Oscillospiraceae bacterium]|nr:SCP2 sterol-binding domain-containing protein [Oscillospiraceae bacterium]